MSGAPCFFQHADKWPTDDGQGVVLGHVTLLLGVVNGHFTDHEPAKVSKGFVGELATAINTGVGLVTPARFILEVLQELAP